MTVGKMHVDVTCAGCIRVVLLATTHPGSPQMGLSLNPTQVGKHRWAGGQTSSMRVPQGGVILKARIIHLHGAVLALSYSLIIVTNGQSIDLVIQPAWACACMDRHGSVGAGAKPASMLTCLEGS